MGFVGLGRASKGLEGGSQCGEGGGPESSLKIKGESTVCLPGEPGMEPVGQGPLKDPGKEVLWSDEQSGE